MAYNVTIQKLWNLCNVLRDDELHIYEYVAELNKYSIFKNCQ